ncbi:PD-(D/E)XK motif protein [Pseudomonas lactis]|uniref:PD-(D/E)XK motif protein n=1 Tax=Pseudomonas lactis TaxID=1615674 RepID=UPI001294F54A|nr:PD-(D/E)XK motif protein [Pseudomonas lactis]MQB16224.1 PD-(D/E)XK motif protein [Pseudomonas lactis]
MLDEWGAIVLPTDPGCYNIRLADSSHPLDFRIGRDSHGLFVFQLDGECALHRMPALPRMLAVTCEVHPVASGRSRLVLSLSNASDFRNFALMCKSLMLATEKLAPTQSGKGLLQAIKEVHRWQEMLSNRADRLLSKSERIGLVGELLFLRDVLSERIGWNTAIKCWNGPSGHEQDFVVAGSIFEVKTQVVTADRRIRISSEDQLDAVQGRILLCSQGIAPTPSAAPSALTLYTLVSEIRDALAETGANALERLEIALLEAGYQERPEYDEESWVLVDRIFYEVSNDFPRIERGDLRPGVEMVNYSIRVSDCSPFIVSHDDAFEGIEV